MGKPGNTIAFQGLPGAYSHIARNEGFPHDDRLPSRPSKTPSTPWKTGDAKPADPDREFARRPRRRHSSPAAELGPAYHRRAFPADPPSAAWRRGRDANDVKTVESHAQALGQCRTFIRKRAQARRRRYCRRRPSTSPNRRHEVAAIAPRWRPQSTASTAAPISRGRGSQCDALCRHGARGERRRRPRSVHTTLIFQVRNVPAALYKALGGFATNGVNMTKLESYMGRRSLLRHPVLCRRRRSSRRPGPAAFALEELKFFSARIPHRRRISGASVPRDVQRDAGLRLSFRGAKRTRND